MAPGVDKTVEEVITTYYGDATRLMDILMDIQDQLGFLSHETTAEIARALGIAENFRYADIKKRHKAVFNIFVQSDDKGHFWLQPDYLILERG